MTLMQMLVTVLPTVACWCGYHDPDSPREWDDGVMYLRCERCGRRSVGLRLAPPKVKA